MPKTIRNAKEGKHVLINRDIFEEIAKAQSTQVEIAAFLGISRSTLYRWAEEEYGKPLGEVLDDLQEAGKASLRRAMWRKAIAEGSERMQVWLSKNELDMSDKVDNLHRQELTVEEVRARLPEALKALGMEPQDLIEGEVLEDGNDEE